MHQSFVLRRRFGFSRSFPLSCLSLSALGLLLGLFLGACEPVNISDPTTTPTDSSAGFATLAISNRIDQDPSKLQFLLFTGTSVDFTNAANAKLLGTVDTGATVSFKVPVGTWKIASKNTANVLEPMLDENAPGQEWLKSVFRKDEVYTLILTSDNGVTVWTPNYTTIPAMSSN